MRKNKIFFWIIFLIIILVVAIFSFNYYGKKSVVGNKEILNEINRLLIPLDAKNITQNDFGKLKELVKGDEYASGEVNEMIVLAKYKEYSHIGHGLGFIYGYTQTGNQPICPGHLLSHYYIFSRHNETDLANSNFADAKTNLQIWENSEKNQIQNYVMFDKLFNDTIKKIDAGNLNASDDEISVLSEAPCAKQ